MKTVCVLLLFPLLTIATAAAQPSVPPTYEVYALAYGTPGGHVAVNDIAPGGSTTDSVAVVFYVWYLKGSDGRRVLVDAGLHRSDGTASFASFTRPDSALLRLGVPADSVTDLVITHAHYDHIGGIDLFPHARVWMQRRDYVYFVSDAWQQGAMHRGLEKEDVPKAVAVNLEGRMHFVDGDSVEFLPGIRCFIGAKHTFESQHLLVRATGGNVLLASDDAWFYYNLDHAASIPLTFDMKAYARSLVRMKTLIADPSFIVPGHDALVLTRYPHVAPNIVRIR